MMKTCALLLFGLLIGATCHAATRYVSSYGALPDDGNDDTASINAAIASAGAGDTVLFDAGVYDLITPYNDDHHIRVYQKTNLTLRGATAGGKPSTRLLRHVSLADRETLPHTIYNAKNTDVTFENFIADNSPRHCTAGTVVAKDSGGTWIRVKLFDGLPMDEGTGCYAANAWLPTTPPVLKKVPSLTYGTSPGGWTVYDAGSRIMELSNTNGLDFINEIEVNELMSWHYGTDGENQMDSWDVKGLTLRNFEIPNSINAWTLIALCKDVTLEHIKVASDNGSLTVGPRDAFHISRCTGFLMIDDVDIEGVRMDPIVLRSAYGSIYSKSDSTHFRIEAATGGQPMPAGSKLGLWTTNGILYWVTVASATWSSLPVGGYDVVTAETIPSWADVGTELKMSACMPDSVVIQNCDFRNNAACDVILFTDNVTLVSNTHTRAMYPAIYLGSNNSSAGICGSNIRILNSFFTDCGWELKNGVSGSISMDNVNVRQTARIYDLKIQGNTFKNTETSPAIYLNDIDVCDVSTNIFTNVLTSVVAVKATTSNISVHDNTGIGCIATASDSYTDRNPVYAINGAGMAGDTHTSSGANGLMWMGANSGLPKWFKIDMGQSYDLNSMEIYNFNWAGYTNRGCKNVQLYYSNAAFDPGNPQNNPGDWTSLGSAFDLAQAPGTDLYNTPDVISLPVSARWVSLKINSNYGGGYCGLSEIRFYCAVSLTAPTNGASYTAPASITMTANASDANGTITNVSFYSGATLLGSDTSVPYVYTWTNVAQGSYNLTACAWDNSGAVSTSAVTAITVLNAMPSVSLAAPTNGASFREPASIEMTANASDANGTITNVSFYNGVTLLGSDASVPYVYTWTNVVQGLYNLTARAWDNSGAVSTSAVVAVTVLDPVYTLTVNSGTGGGSYTNGQQVAISADAPTAGKVFSQWIGHTQYVNNVTYTNALVTMSTNAVTLTATYVEGPGFIVISNFGTTYTQDFNTLPSSGTNLTWENNSTISGWYRNYSGTTAEPGRDLSLQTGTNNTSGVVSEIGFMNTGASNSTDRSVTLRAAGTVTNVAVGAVFQNNSGQTAAGFSVGYTGEQWRRVSTNPASLYFEYAVVSSINKATLDIQADDLGWTRVSALEFVSPQLGTGTGLHGAKPAYQTVFSPVTNSVTIANGKYLVIRWLVTDPVINPALGIDDVAVTMVSGSSSFALTVSAGVNGTVSPTTAIVPAGNSTNFVITASNYYRIATLTTNGTAVTGMSFDNNSTTTNFIWSNVQTPGVLAATFTAQVATNAPAQVPYEWLAQYGLTNYNTDATNDADLDGLTSWQEYIAGTNPTNGASSFKAAQNTRNTITWSAVSGRVYSVYWSTNLMKGFQSLETNIPYPQSSYTNANPDSRVNHYQIKVRMQ